MTDEHLKSIRRTLITRDCNNEVTLRLDASGVCFVCWVDRFEQTVYEEAVTVEFHEFVFELANRQLDFGE